MTTSVYGNRFELDGPLVEGGRGEHEGYSIQKILWKQKQLQFQLEQQQQQPQPQQQQQQQQQEGNSDPNAIICQFRLFNVDFRLVRRPFVSILEEFLEGPRTPRSREQEQGSFPNHNPTTNNTNGSSPSPATSTATTTTNSSCWERAIVAYCQGTFSAKMMKGILNSKRIELYGDNTATIIQAIGHLFEHDRYQKSSPIEVIRLRTRLRRDSIYPLVQGLKVNQTLKQLLLTSDFNDADSVLLLAQGLMENKHLELLSLYSCEIYNEHCMEQLILSLEHHPKVDTLELRNNNYLGMSAICQLLRSPNTRLQNLAIYHSPLIITTIDNTNNNEQQRTIPQVDAEGLSRALEVNTSLRTLNLSGNGLCSDSAIWLTQALRVNTTLKSLNLQGNIITDRGIESLADALPDMQGLQTLFLWNNPFSGVGARKLVQGLKSNFCLEEITTFSRFRCSEEIRYYTHLNRAGRRVLVLQNTNQFLCSLWPLVLERVNKQLNWEIGDKASVLYTLIREGPASFAR